MSRKSLSILENDDCRLAICSSNHASICALSFAYSIKAFTCSACRIAVKWYELGLQKKVYYTRGKCQCGITEIPSTTSHTLNFGEPLGSLWSFLLRWLFCPPIPTIKSFPVFRVYFLVLHVYFVQLASTFYNFLQFVVEICFYLCLFIHGNSRHFLAKHFLIFLIGRFHGKMG